MIELEFPPLIESRTQFDDFSNIEVLDANRDFAMQLVLEPEVCSAGQESLWLCFPDEGEAQLALEAWPGRLYNMSTITSIAAAVSASGKQPLKPFGVWVQKAKVEEAAAKARAAPPASLHFVVQPGDGGPIEDWLNVGMYDRHTQHAVTAVESCIKPASCCAIIELLYSEGTPLICLNGALDKVTSGYYSNFLNPKVRLIVGAFPLVFLHVSRQCLPSSPISRSVSPLIARRALLSAWTVRVAVLFSLRVGLLLQASRLWSWLVVSSVP